MSEPDLETDYPMNNPPCAGKRETEECATVKEPSVCRHTPPKQNCPLAKVNHKGPTVDRDSWLNTKLLKIIGIVYGLASPFIVWLVVTIYGQTTELAILKIKMEALKESLTAISAVNSKLDTMNEKMGKMQIDITIIKTKGNIP